MLYKILKAGGKCCNGGHGKWNLPNGKRPGEWMAKIKGDLKPCENGYHLCKIENLLDWLNEKIYEAEHLGDFIESGTKIVVREARLLRKLNWNKKRMQLYAADCAEHILHFFEEKYPDDKRPRLAIEAARKYANGDIIAADAANAAHAANAAAANAAAADAAAAHAAYAHAAHAAYAYAAADAARKIEIDWQLKLLKKYLYEGIEE